MAPALLMSDERAIFLTHDRPFAGYAGFGPVRWHDVRYGYGYGPGRGAGAPGGVATPPAAGRPDVPGLPGVPGAPALPFAGFAGLPDGVAPPVDGLLPFGPAGGNPLGTAPGNFAGNPLAPDSGFPPGGGIAGAVPEPATWMTMMAGLMAVGFMLRRGHAAVSRNR